MITVVKLQKWQPHQGLVSRRSLFLLLFFLYYDSEFLRGCRLLETVINFGSQSQRGPAGEDRKISRAGDLLSEDNQQRRSRNTKAF